ncbi:MAG: nucleotidyltransferase family protein, partial [Prevotella sp.]|nr:nucleotidyltransferase family protein [Prevotella sp.]
LFQMDNFKQLPIGKAIATPTPDFNVIFQLTHLMRHFIYEGIVLKQLVDYFYVLKSYYKWNSTISSPTKNTDGIIHILKRIKMLNFAGILMYIMKEGFGIEEKYLIIDPNEKVGKKFLESIIEEDNDDWGLKSHSKLNVKQFSSLTKRFTLKTFRAFRLLPFFPEEIIWGLFYRTKKNIKFD